MEINEMQAEFFRALSSPLRLRILQALREKNGCVTDLTKSVNDTQPQVSRALMSLKQAGLVECEKKGATTCYRLKSKEVFRLLEISKCILRRESEHMLNALKTERKGE